MVGRAVKKRCLMYNPTGANNFLCPLAKAVQCNMCVMRKPSKHRKLPCGWLLEYGVCSDVIFFSCLFFI